MEVCFEAAKWLVLQQGFLWWLNDILRRVDIGNEVDANLVKI